MAKERPHVSDPGSGFCGSPIASECLPLLLLSWTLGPGAKQTDLALEVRATQLFLLLYDGLVNAVHVRMPDLEVLSNSF